MRIVRSLDTEQTPEPDYRGIAQHDGHGVLTLRMRDEERDQMNSLLDRISLR